MAASRTGTPSIIRLARKICHLKALWGAVDLASRTTPEFAAAVSALVAACEAFEALDDSPGQIDNTAPFFEGDPDGAPL